MSEPYAVFGFGSDVHVDKSEEYLECIQCFDCKMRPRLLRADLKYGFVAETAGVMIAHLHEHIFAGHKVPEGAFARLLKEAMSK